MLLDAVVNNMKLKLTTNIMKNAIKEFLKAEYTNDVLESLDNIEKERKATVLGRISKDPIEFDNGVMLEIKTNKTIYDVIVTKDHYAKIVKGKANKIGHLIYIEGVATTNSTIRAKVVTFMQGV